MEGVLTIDTAVCTIDRNRTKKRFEPDTYASGLSHPYLPHTATNPTSFEEDIFVQTIETRGGRM